MPFMNFGSLISLEFESETLSSLVLVEEIDNVCWDILLKFPSQAEQIEKLQAMSGPKLK